MQKTKLIESLFGGGVQSKSLVEIPKKIEEMLANYKKIAHIKSSFENTTIQTNLTTDFVIRTYTNFIPSKVLISFWDVGFNEYVFTNIIEIKSEFEINYSTFKISFKEATEENVTLLITPISMQRDEGITIKEMYLIE